MTLIITPRNKQQEKVVTAFLSSLNIGFHSEAEEDAALMSAMQKGRKNCITHQKRESRFPEAFKTR